MRCACCGCDKDLGAFSGAQKKKPASKRKCTSCTAATAAATTTAGASSKGDADAEGVGGVVARSSSVVHTGTADFEGGRSEDDTLSTSPYTNAVSAQAGEQHLREGGRIELTGLSSEDLNGQRGGISGSYLDGRGRWPVVVDGTGRELSCKPTNLKELASCGDCGAEKRLDALKKCARCLAVHYCDGACQRKHWKRGGHKEACREQFACVICLDNEEHPLPIQCGCGCRDSAGCAHVACKTAYAEHQGPGYHERWHRCPTCKQDYTGAMQLGLADALWARLQSRPPEDDDRQCAQNFLAGAYFRAGRLAEAEVHYLDLLATSRRVYGSNHSSTLKISGNLGRTLIKLDKHIAAEALFRDTLDRHQNVLGPEDKRTLAMASSLALTMENQGKYAEAEPLLRDTLATQQRVLVEGHPGTLVTAMSLAMLLIRTGQFDKAEELCRGALVQAHRTLGPEHPQSLHIAHTLATVHSQQGRTTEAVALLKATLDTQQRVMGPGHPHSLATAGSLRFLQQRG